LKTKEPVINDLSLENLLVEPMPDGGMGSLRLFPYGHLPGKKVFGRRVAEIQFNDIDNVDVIASLNVDNEGVLFELDVWKTDFSVLKRIPEEFQTDMDQLT
jgi:hypothetical protein